MEVFLKTLLGLKNKDTPCGDKQSYKQSYQQKQKKIPSVPTPPHPHFHSNRPTVPAYNINKYQQNTLVNLTSEMQLTDLADILGEVCSRS